MDAQGRTEADFGDGRLRMLRLYSDDGQLRQRITYHYTSHQGLWYPSSDIVEYFRDGSLRTCSGTHYHYSDTLGQYRLTELSGVLPDGTMNSLYFVYADDGLLSTIMERRNGSPQRTLLFSPGDSVYLATHRKLDRLDYRRTPPDPREERLRLNRALSICDKEPSIVLAPVDGKCFLFNAEGLYLSRINFPGHDNEMILWPGDGQGLVTAFFADPVEDPESLYTGTQVIRPSDEGILGNLEMSSSFDPQYHGFFKGCFFLARESGYGGNLDFAVDPRYGVLYDGLYLTTTQREGSIVHNNFNYGNFLWGASARAVGVPLWVARLGAHFNNFFLSPDTRGTFDSPDDQFSIKCGHHFLRERRPKRSGK